MNYDLPNALVLLEYSSKVYLRVIYRHTLDSYVEDDQHVLDRVDGVHASASFQVKSIGTWGLDNLVLP